MARPRHIPGERLAFETRPRNGKKSLGPYLASRLGVAEARARELLAAGAVVLDGLPAREDELINLSGGRHRIEVLFPPDWPKYMAPAPLDLSILYEDDWLLAVDKPPGLVVHPARGHLDGLTLQNGVRHRYRHLLGRPGVTIGPPHRLDRDTSGVVVFALRTDAYSELVRQFGAGEPDKEYVALADGTPERDSWLSDEAVGVDPHNPRRGGLVPVERGGKAAATQFRVLARGRDVCLLSARPRTGRSHQIRLHAAGRGLPILGDRDYNPDPEKHGAKRQALHARTLRFRHPADGRAVEIHSPPPADMTDLMRALGVSGFQ